MNTRSTMVAVAATAGAILPFTVVPTAATADPSGTPPPPPRAVVHLGDLNPPASAASEGAAFDPCSPALWDAVPPQARPSPLGSISRLPKDGPDDHTVMCRRQGQGDTRIYTAWGPGTTMSPLPQHTTYAGKLGDRADEPDRCQTRVHLAQGVAAVMVYKAPDRCQIAEAVTNAIAGQNP